MARKIFLVLLFSLHFVFAQEATDGAASRIVNYPSVLSVNNKKAIELYRIGSEFIRNNNLHNAEKYLKDALSLEPNFYEALDHLGIVYKRQDKLAEAEQIFLRSLKINPNNVVPYVSLANIYAQEDKIQEASEVLIRAIIIDPKYPEPYYELAAMFQALREFQVSVSYAKIAIELYLGNSAYADIYGDDIYYAYRVQAVNYLELYQFEEAILFFEKANVYFRDNSIQQAIFNIKQYIGQ